MKWDVKCKLVFFILFLWRSRAHYDKIRHRDDERRQKQMRMHIQKMETRAYNGPEVLAWCALIFFATMIFTASVFDRRSYDQPSKRTKRDDSWFVWSLESYLSNKSRRQQQSTINERNNDEWLSKIDKCLSHVYII